MPRVKDYKLVQIPPENDSRGSRLMELLGEGWQPWGAPVCHERSVSTSPVMKQAMVLYEDDASKRVPLGKSLVVYVTGVSVPPSIFLDKLDAEAGGEKSTEVEVW